MSRQRTEFSKKATRAANARLIAAAKAGDPAQVLRALLDGADINTMDGKKGRTAAHWAAAANALGAVIILTARQDEEAAALAEHLPGISLNEASLQLWRAARQSRTALVVDRLEGCFPSAFAPLGTDASERTITAHKIWNRLMKGEADECGSPFALLEVWKPSSVMEQSCTKYTATLPPGSADPVPDDDEFAPELD